MVLVERLFGILSLVFLSIGLIVGLAGIDPKGKIDLTSYQVDEELHEVGMIDEIDEVSRYQLGRDGLKKKIFN